MTCNCQFHQHGNYIHVLVKGKGLKSEDLDVQIQRRRLTVVLNKVTLVEGLLQGQVDVGNSKVKVHSDHAEIRLRKANEGEEWPQLLLGCPDMMTSLQRAQQSTSPSISSHGPMSIVSPESSPTRRKPTSPKNVVGAGVESLNMSLSNLVHKVFTTTEQEPQEMRDDAIEYSA